MYQQADTTNLLGRRRWTSGLQGYLTSEALARRMPVQSARAPAGWTGLGTTPTLPLEKMTAEGLMRSTSPTPVGSPPYAAPPGLMWVWKGLSSFWATATYPGGGGGATYYAWHLQKGPGYSPTVLAEYYRQNPEYIARDNATNRGEAPPLAPPTPLVTTSSAPVTTPPAAAAEVSAIDKVKAWLAEETIMPGYANQWFVVGAVAAYFLFRKK